MGITTAASAKVGNAIGSGDHKLAYRYALVSIRFGLYLSILSALILYSFRKDISSFYTTILNV
jgi:Na+-driven multidrug efflux pump